MAGGQGTHSHTHSIHTAHQPVRLVGVVFVGYMTGLIHIFSFNIHIHIHIHTLNIHSHIQVTSYLCMGFGSVTFCVPGTNILGENVEHDLWICELWVFG